MDADPCGLCKFTIKIGINVRMREYSTLSVFAC